MRRRGVLLIVGVVLLTAVGIVAFLAQRPPADPPPPPALVAKVAEVSSTPLAVQVVMQRGSDRVLQAELRELDAAAVTSPLAVAGEKIRSLVDDWPRMDAAQKREVPRHDLH